MRVEIPPLNTAGPMQVKAATILSSLVLCLKEKLNDIKFKKRINNQAFSTPTKEILSNVYTA